MRTTWESWDLDDMQDAADAGAYVEMDALPVPEQTLVETLPYYGAFSDYRDHVVGCADCREDSRPDCAKGAGLLEVSRIGVTEQHHMALDN